MKKNFPNKRINSYHNSRNNSSGGRMSNHSPLVTSRIPESQENPSFPSTETFWNEPSEVSTTPVVPILSMSGPTPLPPTRRRSDTEDTDPVKNLTIETPNMPARMALPVEIDSEHKPDSTTIEYYNVASKDDETVVSSLSNDEDDSSVIDSFALLPHNNNHAQAPPLKALTPIREITSPPVEVAVFSSPTTNEERGAYRMDELVARLAVKSNPSSGASCAPPVSSSSRVPKPILARNRSCPAPTTSDFASVASTISASNKSGILSSRSVDSIPEDSILVNGSLVEGISHRDGESTVLRKDSALLGNRKRRTHRQCYSGTDISIGSIVGQSTLLTSTSGASITSSEASSVRRQLKSAASAETLLRDYSGASDGIACCQVRKPKNLVKEEFKFVVGKVTSPIRLLLPKEKKAQLQRSTGKLV